MNDERTWVYFVLCRDGYIYVGVASDPVARFRQHCTGKGSMRFRSAAALLGAVDYPSRKEALQAEYRIKRLRRKRKLQLAAASSVDSAWQEHLSRCRQNPSAGPFWRDHDKQP